MDAEHFSGTAHVSARVLENVLEKRRFYLGDYELVERTGNLAVQFAEIRVQVLRQAFAQRLLIRWRCIWFLQLRFLRLR